MAELESRYATHRLWEAPEPDAFLKKIGPEVRAVVTNGARGASASLIGALPNLEVIVSYGVGVDAIDLPVAKKRGIPVATTPEVLTEDVADMALALLLGSGPVRSRRHLRIGSTSAYQRVRSGQYQFATIPEPLTLQGWQLVDELNRAFAGEKPSGYAVPVHIVIRENVEFDGSKNSVSDPDNGYRDQYKKIWGK
jgi:lactate dehydrogenase-like 2-hydroxyacid dehydrogenase